MSAATAQLRAFSPFGVSVASRYGIRIPKDELWAMRLAEKLRASNINLQWVRIREHLDLSEILRRHPAIHLLISETNREIGEHGSDDEVYWSVLNAAFDAPIEFFSDDGRTLRRRVRLRARA